VAILIENNEENREKLAEAVVTSADMDDVVSMAINGCTNLYERDNDKFLQDWEDLFGDSE
jgi:hypothetical protein